LVRSVRSFKLDINVKDILEILNSKITGGTKTAINVTYSILTGLFNFAVRVDNSTIVVNESNNLSVGSITESQISDFGTYLTEETDPVFIAWDKSTGISITESQVSDLKTYAEIVIPPVSASASGTAGQISYDSSFLYVCVDTDTWLRASITTWV
jgi:hypothetical protein